MYLGDPEPAKACIGEHFKSGSVFCIANAQGGTVIESLSDGVFDMIWHDKDTQKWIVEYEGDVPNKISFKNLSNGQYLTAQYEMRNSPVITTGDVRWWVPYEGKLGGSFLFKYGDFNDRWLYNWCGEQWDRGQTQVLDWQVSIS